MGVQVQTATKNGRGESLSILDRQFISFSYGGKNIEDFDLLVIFNNARLEKEAYALFNDTTTKQAELDGQLFWRSNFEANKIVFNLATDGMTSEQLENFKTWFKPGIERELILSEFPNRGILARVSTSPHLSLLPFEKEVTVSVGGNTYKTKTSLYKGDITLEFVMDDPYWYSIASFLDSNSITPEQVKIILEDGVPHKNMFYPKEELNSINCFLANKYYFNGTEIKEEKVTLNKDTNLYLYYCGTAAEKPTILFNTKLKFLDKGTIAFSNNLTSAYIAFGAGEEYQKLEFTLPSLFASYNSAIKIVEEYLENKKTDIIKLRAQLRDSLYNYYTRSYIIGVIDDLRNNDDTCVDKNSGTIISSSTFLTNFIAKAKDFYNPENTLHCEINNKTGQVTISTTVNNAENIIENAGNMIKSNYLSIDTRKMPNSNGRITSSECLLVTVNFDLINLQIDYKYMYL